MILVIVRHKVEDYAQWHKVFTEHGAVRKSHGSKGARVLRNLNDDHEQFVISDWDTMEAARAFVEDPRLREAMQRAGVTDKPDIYFVEQSDTQDY